MEVLERLERIARDRGKVQNIFTVVSTLKGADGRILFGPHMNLTNLYVSRDPLSRESTRFGLARNDKLVDKEDIKHFYDDLKNGPEPQTLPPELRPDVPLVVVVSGEVEVQSGNKTAAKDMIGSVGEALKIKEQVRNRDIKIVYSEDFVANYEETIPEYDFKGDLKKVEPGAQQPATPAPTPAAEPAGPTKYTFIPFHILFVWEDPADKDRVPPPAAAPVPAP
jgi:hypothetical protein